MLWGFFFVICFLHCSSSVECLEEVFLRSITFMWRKLNWKKNGNHFGAKSFSCCFQQQHRRLHYDSSCENTSSFSISSKQFLFYTLESVFLGFIFERFFYSSLAQLELLRHWAEKNWKRIFFILNWKWNLKTCKETSPSGIPINFFERIMTSFCAI